MIKTTDYRILRNRASHRSGWTHVGRTFGTGIGRGQRRGDRLHDCAYLSGAGGLPG